MGSHIHQQFPYPLIWLWPVSFCYMVTSISQFVIASTAIHYSSSWTPSLSEWKHIAICSFLALVCCNFRHIVMWCDVIYLLPVRSPVSTKCFPWFLVALKPKKQRWLYPSTALAELILHCMGYGSLLFIVLIFRVQIPFCKTTISFSNPALLLMVSHDLTRHTCLDASGTFCQRQECICLFSRYLYNYCGFII